MLKELPAQRAADQRARRASGDQPRQVAKADPALQVCDCGKQFRAPVTTHVICPRCGREQAW